MREVADELTGIVQEYAKKIAKLSEVEFSAKTNPEKWSKKEVLGHLTDSAENNLRRFICGQYESPPPKIKYDQNFWVTANDYQHSPSIEVIENWKLINLKICRVLASMPKENYSRMCEFGDGKLLTLEWLAIDYVKHLKHHLNQIIPSSFQITYP